MELTQSKKRIILVGCTLLMMTVQLSAMGLNNTMYVLMAQMNGQAYFSLMSVLSTLGMCITAVITGRLGDIFGRRNTTLYGALSAVVFMCLMAFTKSLAVFIVARGLLAIGIGMFTPNPFVICSQIYPREKHAQISAILSTTMAIAGFLGSTIAGALVDQGMNEFAIIYPGIVGIIGAVLVYVNLPKKVLETKPDVDYPGMVLFIIFVTTLALSFNFVGNLGYTNPMIVTGFVIAIIAFIMLYRVEKKAAIPVVPFYLFKNLQFSALCIIAPLYAFFQITMGIYVPVTGQQIMGVGAAVTGLWLMPRTIISIICPMLLAALVVKKSSRPKAFLVLAGLCVALPFLGMMTTNEATPFILPSILLAFTALGDGLNTVASQPMIVKCVDQKDVGVGIGLQNTCRSLGMTVATALVGAIYTQKSTTDLNGALHIVYAITFAIGIAGSFVVLFMLKNKKEEQGE